MSDRYDVVVVGCGIAGTAAAAAAAQRGARVAVLERSTREERGGNTRYTAAMMLMKSEDAVADSFVPRLVECAGGVLDPGLLDHTARSRPEWPATVRALAFVDPDLMLAFADGAAPAIAWLREAGIDFDAVPSPYGVGFGYLAPRGGGLAMIDALAAEAERCGATFHYETTARSLRVDARGRSRGLIARRRGGETVEIDAPAVVLASGGFQGNPEMLARYIGPRAIYMKPYAPGGYNDRGEGIEMALAVGAAAAGEYSGYHAQAVDPRSRLIGENAMYGIIYGILVNADGRRFADEAGGNPDLPAAGPTRMARVRLEALTRRIPEQPGGTAYLILDAKVDALPNRGQLFHTDAPPVRAPSLGALARALGIRADALEETVRAFNAACPASARSDPLAPDGRATVGLAIPKSHWAGPIDAPPFTAYPIVAANVFTFGGLKVDPDARVIRTDGDPIPGLYAAGETVGIYYRDYLGATSVLRGAVFGRLAGLHAASIAVAVAT